MKTYLHVILIAVCCFLPRIVSCQGFDDGRRCRRPDNLYGRNTVSMTYDEYGRQKTLSDHNAGVISYTYNAFGELNNQTDARENSYDMYYDKLGRLDYKELNGTTIPSIPH